MKKTLTRFLLSFLLIAGITAFAKVDAKAAVPVVTGLKQTDDGNSSADVSWNPVSGNWDDIAYEVKVRKDGQPDQVQTSYSSYDYINNLASGSSYYVSVRACVENSSGQIERGAYSPEIEVVTAPKCENDLTIKQTKAGKNSAAFQWSAVPGANLYKVVYGPYDKEMVKYVTKNSISISNLKKDTSHTCYITAIRKNANDTYRAANTYGSYGGKIALVPNKLSYDKSFFFYPKEGKVSLYMNHEYYADGFEYQFYTAYNKKDTKIVSKHNTSGYITVKDKALKYTKTTRIYKVRVRAYKKAENGKKFYTNWTDWKYFCNELKKPTLKNQKSKGIEVSWKKIGGADGYKIYASTNPSKGYKVVADIKNGKTLKTTFKKYNKKALQSNKTYYVYVSPQKKVDGKWRSVEASDIYAYGVKYKK